MSNPQANFIESEQFLSMIHVGRTVHLIAIKEGKALVANSFGIDERESMSYWIAKQNLDEYNIYWHVNIPKASFRSRKAKKDDIAQAAMLHVDLDELSEEALERLKNYSPRPSIIICSGGGYQAFWLFDVPTTDLDAVENINRAIAQKLGADDCHNIDRIMRVPGTINWPNTKKQEAGRVPVLSYVL